MKILALRGRNLASLAGDFDVDFRREPLASAGLFAICGRTGSGKSTLLDALCLALYDDTPRLARAGSRAVVLPDVGDDKISPSDPRTLLRRGAEDGYAEVEFVGTDEVEYRARWYVRRARGRVDGRLQASEMTLVRVRDSQKIGALKTEVLPAIRERVGLGFEQFTRAVLLAQNEFNAFLNADDNKRAELLELLTGTEAYTRISARAFERAKAERQALEALKLQAAGEQPLDEAARRDLEASAAKAAAVLAGHEAEGKQLDEHIRWRDDVERARHDERLAQEGRDAAARSRDEATPRFRQLDLVEAVQPAAPLLRDHTQTEAALRAVRDVTVPAKKQQALDAEAALGGAQAAFDSAKAAVSTAELAEREAGPPLNAARVLDAQIEDVDRRHREATGRLEAARTACLDACARRDEVRATRDACATERDQHRDWLEAHADLSGLEAQWPRWDTLFGQAARLEAEVAGARKALADSETKLAGAQAKAEEAAGHREHADSERRELEAQLGEAEQRLASFDVPGLAAERQQTQSRRDALIVAQTLEERLRGQRTRRTELQEELQSEAGRAAKAEAACGRLEVERVAAAAALQQAERTLNEVRLAAAANVRKLRDGLEEGRPCPVCGAVEHPYAAADHEAPGKAALLVVEREADTCRDAVEALVRQLTEQQTVASHARDRCGEVERELAAIREVCDDAERLWREHPVAAEAADVAHADLPAWLQAAVLAAEERVREAGEREAEGARAAAAREDARKVADAARETCQRLERVEAEARTAVEGLKASVESGRATVARLEGDRDRVLAELDVALVDSGAERSGASSAARLKADRDRLVTELDARTAVSGADRSGAPARLEADRDSMLPDLGAALAPSAEDRNEAAAAARLEADRETVLTDFDAAFALGGAERSGAASADAGAAGSGADGYPAPQPPAAGEGGAAPVAASAESVAAWRNAWRLNPDAFHEERRRQAAEYGGRRKALDECGTRLSTLEAKLAGLEQAAGKAAEDVRAAEDVVRRLEEELGSKRSARAALFEGRPVEEVERGLRGSFDRAKRLGDDAEARLKTATAAHATASSQLEEAQSLLAQCEAQAAAALATVSSWLAEFNADGPRKLAKDAPGLAALSGPETDPAGLVALPESDMAARAALREPAIDTPALAALLEPVSSLAALLEPVSGLAALPETEIDRPVLPAQLEPALDMSALAALLAHDARWMAAERAKLRELEDAVRQAQAVLEERARRRQQVEELGLTDEALDVLRDRRTSLAGVLEAARTERAALDARLLEDDGRRARTKQLTADIVERESVAALWARMSDLVGSADGRKFRNYAQQLTLDVLLAYANRHLVELARRYSLRRLPETLALIVIDHDMADEVRSAHSLSGGESFLASLALALGLASLSANRVRVESLFIDEGFGSLDAETLGVAMDALDRLQAQGRKVGVISHVQELAERLGTRIEVEKQSGGRSRVMVAG